MPQHVWTQADRKAKSLIMKAAWRKRKRQKDTAHLTVTAPSLNGLTVEQRIVLHVQDSTHDLTLAEAKTLHDALHTVIFTEPKAE